MGGEKTLPRAIIGVWNKKNRCGIKRLTSEENSLFYSDTREIPGVALVNILIG